ncbi:mitochondrial OXA complex Oxa1 subunit (core chaperone) [Andalucia godoyi]|uniref:Mitochondrial OXA complex Oxa1 subunit (Core chaperone) n=1 Tax=Andalucia godoyi TaxID=505711 RepID=A0A8K0AIM0_ANDGO|nr:mitochondrial OXA complex Oxa1 subunit (core chaperone) [Andalucia godoyi]|eukprot:ANDGO_05893.mRNA.1 mitochondrial OXA complex Oxa1 subunit (core chaperone)
MYRGISASVLCRSFGSAVFQRSMVQSRTPSPLFSTSLMPSVLSPFSQRQPVRYISYPSDWLGSALESIHASTGLPWWITILTTTVVFRVATLPLVVKQMRNTANLTMIRPQMEELNAKIKDIGSSGLSPMEIQAARINHTEQLRALFQKHDCHPMKAFVNAFVQMPIFLTFFITLRNLAENCASLKVGGISWFTDLTTADPLYIFPLLSSLTFLTTIELGADTGVAPMGKGIRWFFRALAVGMFFLTMSMPKAVFLYWTASNFFSLISSRLLQRDAVRRALNIPLNSEVKAALARAGMTPKPQQPGMFDNIQKMIKERSEQQKKVHEVFLDSKPKATKGDNVVPKQ